MGTWVIGDVHGCYDEFIEMVNRIEKLDKSPTFILIGDIEDRGPKSREMMDWAVENVTDNGKFQMVLGNHEDNIITSFESALDIIERYGENKESAIVDRYLYSRYGLEEEFVGVTLAEFEKYIDFFKSLPLYKEIQINGKKYIIAHAWYSEMKDRRTIISFRDVKEGQQRVGYRQMNGEILIHGHTPTIMEHCTQFNAEAGKIWDKGKSVNIDCGLAYRVTLPEHPMCKYGNLAAYRLEDRRVLYLYE